MKLNILHILLYLFICSACNSEEKFSVDYVDPFIGTGFHGHTYPGATAPFGAVQLSPDTRVGNWDASRDMPLWEIDVRDSVQPDKVKVILVHGETREVVMDSYE